MEQPKKYPGNDYQELYDHMYDEHNLILLEGQMQDIIHIVNKMQVPDRESELIEMLERVLRLKPLIQYPDDVQLEFEDEAIAVNNLIRDIESLINKK